MKILKETLKRPLVIPKRSFLFYIKGVIKGMAIYVNDKEVNFEGNIKELLEFLDYKPERVAVLVNGEIVKKDRWETYKLKEKDYIEIVTLVGGG